MNIKLNLRKKMMVLWLLVIICITITGIIVKAIAQNTKSKEASDASIVSFKNGYCKVEGPWFVMAKAGAKFAFGPEVEYRGQKFQVMIPKSQNAYAVSSITVQFLTKTKEPLGPAKKLECARQNWNEKEKTVDFHYYNDTIHVIVHIYPAMGRFIIKDIECLSPKKAK